nr:hypothetical protein [Tanacetum cinerariifolium]
HHGCGFLLGKVVEVRGSSVRVVEWAGKEGSRVMGDGGKSDTITTEEITLAQALEALKTSKPKVKGIVFQEPGLMKKLLKGYKMNLMRKKDLKERAKKEQEANIALIETWDDIQAKIDEQEIPKNQKVKDDKEKAELKQLMETIPDEKEVAIDSIPLAVNSPMIVDWKIHKEGKKSYYQIVRADGKSQMYMLFSQMLKSFDREDLEDLYNLVKARYRSIRLVENIDYLLWSDMKIIFKPHAEDEVWRRQQGYKVLE